MGISYKDRIWGDGHCFFISVLSEGGGWSPKESQRGFSVFL